MARSASAAAEPPSIVFILSDDQRYDTLAHMPRVQSLVADEGVTFDRSFVSVPLCCPSRTTSLTGLYSHNTGVYDNQRPTGGFRLFEDDSTIATWLHPQYSTALFGKYLNEYNRASYVPPGWDRWVALMDLGDGTHYYDYSLSVDGREQEYGSAPSEYQTTLMTRRAVSFIRDTPGPLFLWFAPSAPHPPAIAAPKDKGTFTGWIPNRLPDFNEEDVSDKNVWTQMLPLLSDTSKLDSLARRQMRALLGLDRAVGRLVHALEETGRLENTMIVYTSDNGMAWGEHRWLGKNAPWEEAIRVPMVVRFDPAVTAPGSTDHHLIVNTDNAPSMADAAGVVAPTTDGTSFLPLLSGTPISWRTSFLLEHMYRYHGRTSASDFPSYCGIRTEDAKYLEYSGGERELYDLAGDPYEMENVADDPGYAALRSSLDAELAGMCSQIPVEP
jgi:arylsulfatase A-like enzyme